MKKLILSIVFVFASFVMVNANSNSDYLTKDIYSDINLDERSCEEQALTVGEAAHRAGMNDEQIFFYMNVALALCEGYTYDEIIAAGNMG